MNALLSLLHSWLLAQLLQLHLLTTASQRMKQFDTKRLNFIQLRARALDPWWQGQGFCILKISLELLLGIRHGSLSTRLQLHLPTSTGVVWHQLKNCVPSLEDVEQADGFELVLLLQLSHFEV